MKIRIATWNINSVRLRAPLVERFLNKYGIDVLCLQETKCHNDQFPAKLFNKLGYTHQEINGQKGYHGVATLSRIPIRLIGQQDFNGTREARHLAVAIDLESIGSSPIVLHNFYVPSGGDEPDIKVNPKFRQKLDYLTSVEKWLKRLRSKRKNRLVLVGDLNVAPLENDVWSHKQLLNVVSHTPIEVEHLIRVQKAHRWIDVMRSQVPEDKKLYTWWSYRARDWRKSNRGRRLDHIWITPALGNTITNMQVIDQTRDWEKPSDHVPVIADFNLKNL